MNESDLTNILKDMYENADKGEQVSSIHLFGIEYSDALLNKDIKKIAIDATGNKSYQTEIAKGRKLGKRLKEKKLLQTKSNSLKRLDTNELKIKNIILYGAPGVGKTHNYQKLISMIENGDSESDIFNSITDNKTSEEVELNKELFQKIKDDKRVEFVTFHQSYSYEDFIEGFRPQKNGNIELEDGIFKKLVYDANFNFQAYKKIIEDNFITDSLMLEKLTGYFFEEEYCIEHISNISFTGVNINSFGGREFTLFFSDIEYFLKYEVEEEKSLYNYLEQKYNNYTDEEVNICLHAHKALLKDIKKYKQKNFYIVIDEINRGNISKIFGELITLIEESKRDNYEVTLPYSKEKFKVPSNLYIIATMNSTDKSIATIDIALRRRFTFLKMKPNSNLVKILEAKELMEKLNIYIEKELGEDYMLGHSYFMGDDIDIEFIKEYKIKPLLEEYFYSDDKTADQIIKEAIGESDGE